MSVLYILPAAVFGHVWMAIFFYSKQVGLDVPMVYYIALLALAVSSTSALNVPSQSAMRPALRLPTKPADATPRKNDFPPTGMLDHHTESVMYAHHKPCRRGARRARARVR